MKKIITTLALASMFGLAGIASAQTTTPATGQTTSGTGQTQTTGTGQSAAGSGSTGQTRTGSTRTSTTRSSSSTVGVPNTGAGGDAPINFAILGTSAAIILAAGAYTLRRSQNLNMR